MISFATSHAVVVHPDSSSSASFVRGKKYRRRRCLVLTTATNDADADADDDADDGGPGIAHVGPLDVRVKRTTPRPVNEVQRTGTRSSMSVKEARRTRRYVPDAYEFHGHVRVRKSGLGVRPGAEDSRFPYGDGFAFESCECATEEMLDVVGPMLNEERKLRLENVLANRTFSLMPVMEAVYDVGNMLAVCRTTEALGIGCAGIVSAKGLSFKASSRTSGGALKWTHVEQFESTTSALESAKKKGYRILVTDFEGAYPMSHYDWTVPTAVVFGSERDGVSDEAKAMCDGKVYIPMYGFTESLNLSVAAALVMSHAVADRLQRQGFHGDLSEEERRILRGVYMSRLIPNYARQGYMEDLIARHRAGAPGRNDEKLVARTGEEPVCDEVLDEKLLLAELDATNLVGRRGPKKDLGWGLADKDVGWTDEL